MNDADLSVRVLTRFDEFLAIKDEWDALFAVAERPVPFLRHGWLRASWELVWRRSASGLRVVLVYEAGQLAMAGAFVLGRFRLTLMMQILGSGTPQTEDILWRQSPRTLEHAALLLAALRKGLRLPRTLRIKRLRADSPLHAAIAASGLPARSRHPLNNFHVPVCDFATYDEYLHSLSSHLRLDHGRRLRRLREVGELIYRRDSGAGAADALAWLLDTKRDWLELKDQKAKWLADRSIDRFLEKVLLAPDAPPHWIATLRLDGRIFAASLCFVERDRMMFSKVAHDQAMNGFSPGRTLTLLMLEDAFAAGVDMLDLGFSGDGWKLRIATGIVEINAERVRLK